MWGKFKLVDFHGEFEFTLFKEDYLRCKDMMIQDNKVMVNGSFQNRWGDENQWEFKITGITLLEEVKKMFTKRLNMTVNLERLDSAYFNFMDEFSTILNRQLGNKGE